MSSTLLRTKLQELRIVQAKLDRLADLMPPLGNPGGTCHVVRRIVEEIEDPRLERQLRTRVEEGDDLTNLEARKVYDPEETNGAWKFQMVLTSHAQYRMDLRGITEPEVRKALDAAFREINNEKSRGDLRRYDLLAREEKIEHLDRKTGVFVAFKVEGRNAVILTVFRPGDPDPRSRPVSCQV